MEREVLTRDYLRFVQEGQDGSESSFVNDATLQLEYSIVRPHLFCTPAPSYRPCL